MPQIEQLSETLSSQVFWLLIFFAITFLVVGLGMVPKVMATVSDRDDRIAADLTAAKAARDAADEQEAAWRARENEARSAAQGVLSRAKAEASAKTADRLAETQRRIDAQMAEADARIEAARTGALENIEAVAADATSDIVARLAGITLSPPEAEAMVRKVMTHG